MTRDYVFGNIFKDEWKDIWFSETAENFRKEKKPLCLVNFDYDDKFMQI
jgi:MoaA/NifB/PqqE/SkfB family radical SAM enzyme